MHYLNNLVSRKAIQNVNKLANDYSEYIKMDMIDDVKQFSSEFYEYRQMIKDKRNKFKQLSILMFDEVKR